MTVAMLAALRARCVDLGLDGLIVPMGDRFLSEYAPAHEQRIAFLSGFTGSAATLVILPNTAALFIDGRYLLQARAEVEGSLYQLYNIADMRVVDWIQQSGVGVLGVDATRISIADAEAYRRVSTLRLLEENLVDALWRDRPACVPSRRWDYPDVLAGESAESKCARVAAVIAAQGADAAFIGSAESVNWLLNVRGGDVPCTPVWNSMALLHASGEVQVFDQETLDALPAALGCLRDKTVILDHRSVTAAIGQYLADAGVDCRAGVDPCALPRAIKNPTELAAIAEIHRRDGAALVCALARMDSAPDECAVAQIVLEERERQEGFLYPSFPTIAGMGAHGAIVHYRATHASNAPLGDGLLLIDSGGQYLGGTTDVTRTVVRGPALPEHKAWFTRVLKGHIALARAQFPVGTTGSQLDVLARQFLWAAGGDYDHGTGHGVGHCLGVHEGPQRISKRPSDIPLAAGMILSNEPGYYREGQYGIRIENLVAVVETQPGYLGFKTLTLAPIDRRLMDSTQLSTAEREWVDAYHAEVLDTLELRVTGEVASWLRAACAPLDARL